MKNIFLLIIAGVLLASCSSKAPAPKKLSTGSKISINNQILEEQYRFVPKDINLQNINWLYQIVAVKRKNEFLSNDQIVKT
ncbi:cag pathogenicity island Cag12 family protein, partial [Campylobacter fetus]